MQVTNTLSAVLLSILVTSPGVQGGVVARQQTYGQPPVYSVSTATPVASSLAGPISSSAPVPASYVPVSSSSSSIASPILSTTISANTPTSPCSTAGPVKSTSSPVPSVYTPQASASSGTPVSSPVASTTYGGGKGTTSTTTIKSTSTEYLTSYLTLTTHKQQAKTGYTGTTTIYTTSTKVVTVVPLESSPAGGGNGGSPGQQATGISAAACYTAPIYVTLTKTETETETQTKTVTQQPTAPVYSHPTAASSPIKSTLPLTPSPHASSILSPQTPSATRVTPIPAPSVYVSSSSEVSSPVKASIYAPAPTYGRFKA